jgi:hypothetical protein
MDDYAALLERVCFTLPKVLGCVLLSDDGLVLSAYPDDGHSVAEAAWLHFSALDEPQRGFLTFPDQVWAYVRHGAYAAFVVAEKGVRAGVLLDQLEQVLAAPDVKVPAQTPPHSPPEPIRIKAPPARAPSPAGPASTQIEDPSDPPTEPVFETVSEPDPDTDSESEIDRVQLAQEFSGLLQMHRADDEASS